MKSLINKKMIRPVAGLAVLALCVSMVSAPALAQPPHFRGGPHYGGRPFGPPHHHGHHGPSDFEKALGVIGAVGAIATIANGGHVHSRYGYHYCPPPRPVYVVPPRPVVVERPVIVERPVVVERPVIVERPYTTSTSYEGTYSPKLGASFRIENMQIPGYKFTAARLMSDPVEGSPLYNIGLRRGDVLTRLDDSSADSLAELERHEKNTLIRYIKTGTTKVLLATVYIPTDTDISSGGETYNVP